MTIKLKSTKDFYNYSQDLKSKSTTSVKQIKICSTGCRAKGALKLKDLIKSSLNKLPKSVKVELIEVGCLGFCAQAPVMIIEPNGFFYGKVETVRQIESIIKNSILADKPVNSLSFKENGKSYPYINDIPFYKNQQKIVLRNCGKIRPTEINDYIASGGYNALIKVINSSAPQDVIETVLKSGIRGRGGAGFPTGLKWKFAAQEKSSTKYLICNADEGDPGAFMDRAILEGDPHAVIEGMLLAAFAIGANKGYIYVRAEYPIAVEFAKRAVKQAEELGLLGNNILNTPFSFSINIKEGAGAFVCGEETALIASIEGERGMPNPKPPFPAQSGLWGKPTVINNVETLANLSYIINKGDEEYASIGTEKSKGTKIFALAGKVKNTGLVEVPMGTTIKQIVYDIGGGIYRDRSLKAVQMGGPSGGCIPKDKINLPVDYDSLASAGAIMGSGGMIVLDEANCMVDMAKYFLEFVQSESCGKCVPCRLGTKRMLETLQRISTGKGMPKDIKSLNTLAMTIKESSLCGLGQTAPNPVLSTLRYFENEYRKHIIENFCESSACKTLVKSPCQNRCPAHINVPHYLTLTQKGETLRALNVIRKRLPLAAVCGYTCYSPCEKYCRRGDLDEPIAIKHIKRFIADTVYPKTNTLTNSNLKGIYPFDNQGKFTPPKTNKKISIIGAGPAGLSAAYFLAIMGHSVIIYDSNSKPGGLLISDAFHKKILPLKVVDLEIKIIKKMGVKIVTNKNISVDSPTIKNSDAVFIATGSPFKTKFNNFNKAFHSSLVNKLKLNVNNKGFIVVDEATQMTSVKGIFAGGDIATTPSKSIINACASGQKAAINIDKYLGRTGSLPQDDDVQLSIEESNTFNYKPLKSSKKTIKSIKIKEARKEIKVLTPYLNKEAIFECKRCLRCDIET